MTYLDSLLLRVKAYEAELQQIQLVVFDVDGVLTDGCLHYAATGEATKVFSVRDGVGLKLLQDVGLEVAVISAKQSAMVQQRMSDLGIQHYFPATKDKLLVLKKLCTQLGIAERAYAYVGDDMVDLKAMQAALVSFCPADAYPMVKESASFVLGLSGGHGVAREVADLILAAQGKYLAAYQLSQQAEFERKR